MSFELFLLTYQKMVTFWTYADESGTTLKPKVKGDCKQLIRFSSVSCLLIFSHLAVKFGSYSFFFSTG